MLASAITFLFAILSLICGPVLLLSRCCCFGGYKATDGLFCPGARFNTIDGEGYTPRVVLIFKVVAFVVVVLAL